MLGEDTGGADSTGPKIEGVEGTGPKIEEEGKVQL